MSGLNQNAKKLLYTGHDLLPKGEPKNQQFGSLSAWTEPQGMGTIRLMLGKNDVPLVQTDADNVIELPEEYARQLAAKLHDALVRLEHLRNLSKLGRLNENAYYSGNGGSTP